MLNRPVLTSTDTQKMMAACKQEAEKNNWAVSIAIVDAAGIPLHVERLDGASPLSVEIALGKAKCSASLRIPSKKAGELLKDIPGLAKLEGLLIQGAVPVIYEGVCIGAIGASGVKADEDEQIAMAGTSVALG